MANDTNWQCPHCERFVTISDERRSNSAHYLGIEGADGKVVLLSNFIVCPNPECKKLTLDASTYRWDYSGGGGTRKVKDLIKHWRLIPDGAAKSFPDYIPVAIRNDYEEACRIVDLSPKASATLSRRCLQGILRNFWGVKPGRLVDEIKAIEDKTDAVTWAAIDAVRAIGNIGAHMEKDINVIIEVDPGEAELLINLIENLMTEWYVGKHEREQRMLAVTAAAAAKKVNPAGP